MRETEERDRAARDLLQSKKIANLEELMAAVGTRARMTVRRTLARVGSLTSYSDRGQYYTLASIPDFDDLGLWQCQSAMFSRFGNLLETAAGLVEQSDAGYQASELDFVLRVESKHALLKLARRHRIVRVKHEGGFVYLSADPGKRRQQELLRRDYQAQRSLGVGMDGEALPEELRAGMILFFSLLDEKRRRLFAGLEAARIGHGGDRRVSEFLGLDPHTVAKGRRELLSDSVDRGRVRRKGGGDKSVEKKRRR